MSIYQLVWTTKNEQHFEQVAPLLWHGSHLRDNGWRNPITLGFLEGLDLLSSEYVNRLEKLGYEILDCSSIVKEISRQHPAIHRYNKTNRYWLLRWNVLDCLTRDEAANKTIVHLDADVVLMADPDTLLEDVQGKTFVLQGCPVFTSISTRDWFDVWKAELLAFLAHPDTYIAHALSIKENPVRLPKEYCNQICYSTGRFHDQDMLEYLIAAGKLPQDRTEEVYRSDFYWIQSPFFPGEWHEEQAAYGERRIRETNDVDFVGNKRLAFHHMQSDFCRYSIYWLYLNKIHFAKMSRYLKVDSVTAREPAFLRMIGTALLYLTGNGWIRKRDLYDVVWKKNPRTGNFFITDIVNSCWDENPTIQVPGKP